jgi:oral-facial-digital syndrome 1 protein
MADTQAATVAADDKENPAALAAAVALREQVYRHVLSSDVLNSVKAHLRAKLYAELKGGNGSGTSRGGGGGGLAWHAQAQHALPPARSPTLHQHILNCLVCDYLLAQQHKYTLSVILSETGSGALPQLSHADILRLVGVLPDSKVHALLTAGSGSGGLPSGGAEGGAASAAGDPPRSRCLAEGMVAALGSLGSHISTHNAACQTSDAEASNGAGGAAGGCGVSSQQLAQRLQAIEAEYCRKSSQLEAAAAQSLEDRMAAYQRDCDARCAAQLQERLAAFRDAELAAVREQESGRHAQLLEAERQGLQQEHHQRLAKLRAQVRRGWLAVLHAA